MNSKIKAITIHGFLIISSLLFVFPLVWMVISMTNSSRDIVTGRVLPGNYFLENFNKVLHTTDFISSFINSTFIAVMITILAILITSFGAYAFQIYYSRTREFVYNLILISMMVPFAALMIPLYRITVEVGLLDTYWAVILQGAAPVLLLFFFRQSLKSFPLEMIEAARIEGASELRIFVSMVMPSMKATYAAASIVGFMTAWNNYLWPLLALKSPELKTLPLTISAMSSVNTPDYGTQMVVITLSTVPMLIIFFALQKYFVEGMVGSSK